MSDKDPYRAIVINVLEKITKKPAEELPPDTPLLELDPSLDARYLGFAIRHTGRKIGIRFRPGLVKSLQADMQVMTIRDLRDVVAYAGGEDFLPGAGIKKKKPGEKSPRPSQSPKKD